jgi:hypothetical protein
VIDDPDGSRITAAIQVMLDAKLGSISPRRSIACTAAAVLLSAAACRAAIAADSGARAVDEAFAVHDEARLGQISAQIDAQEWLRFCAGLPDRRLYFGGLPGGLSLTPGFQRVWWDVDGVFEPWPVAGGWIYGYRFDNPVEQPAGHYLVPRADGGYEFGPFFERPRPVAAWPEFAPSRAARERPSRRRAPPPAVRDAANGPREF